MATSQRFTSTQPARAAQPSAKAAADAQRQQWATALQHPVVQGLLTRFHADIIAKEFLPREDWLRRFDGG